MSYELVRGSTLPDMTGAMQVFVYELRRIPLLRGWVNRGSKPRMRASATLSLPANLVLL